jgi:hypothetical protein
MTATLGYASILAAFALALWGMAAPLRRAAAVVFLLAGAKDTLLYWTL